MAAVTRKRLGWGSLAVVWVSIFPNLETIAAQAVAAVLVVGSYLLAEELRVRRPRRRGGQAAVRATAAPARPRLHAESQ